FPKEKFTYDAKRDVYLCPAGEELAYTTTNRSGYREYISKHEVCAVCPMLKSCTQNQKEERKIQRHIWEDSKEKVIAYRKSENGSTVYKLRSQTIERSFADSKELHGLRRC